ncbi:putative ankyrin repeat protein RF_0381 [Saccostrea cucullata]
MTYKNKHGSNILHIACGFSRLEMCQHIIQHYPDMLKQVDISGWNAALYAAKGGNVKILEFLAKKGVDMTQKTKDGSNILHIACVSSRIEMCKHIIQHYPDMLNHINNYGWNAALYAARGGNVEIIEFLAEKGVDMTQKTKDGNNILHIACVSSRIEMCKHIIQHYPDMLNHINNYGWNAALYAAKGGNVEIIEFLAEKGVDMTQKTKDGSNILHIACVSSRIEMCKHIIQHYPDMRNHINNYGWNAALYAAKGGNVEIIVFLAVKGVDMTYKTKDGGNILHIACVNSRLDLCQYIIQHYPDMLKQVNNNGWNAALYAAQGGNIKILELLAEQGVNMTQKNKHGHNMLDIAHKNSNSEMCQYIIQHYPGMRNKVDDRECCIN